MDTTQVTGQRGTNHPNRYKTPKLSQTSAAAHGDGAAEAGEQLQSDVPVQAIGNNVSHPAHYNGQVPGIECIEVVQWFSYNIGCAMKYLWRHRDKGNPVEDLRKAKQYIEFEIKRIEEFGL